MSREPTPGSAPAQRGCPGLLHDPGLPGRRGDRRPGGGRVAVHDHHLDPVMVAVLPLAALGTFEPVPGVTWLPPEPWPYGRPPVGSALDAVPIPVSDPVVARPLPEGVPDVSFARASLRYAPELPRALDEVSCARRARRAAGRHRFERRRQVESGQRAVALLAARERHPTAGRHPSDELTQADVRAPAHWPTSGRRCSPARCAPTSPWAGPTPATTRSTTVLRRGPAR